MISVYILSDLLDRSARDLLGDFGRKAIKSCFKVQICDLDQGKESVAFYDRAKALEKIGACYEGGLPQRFNSSSFFDPLAQFDSREGHKSTYNIITIREALFNYDQISYVDKYPEESDDPACKESSSEEPMSKKSSPRPNITPIHNVNFPGLSRSAE